MNRGVECKFCQHTENEYVIYCKLQKKELQQYKCSKGQCKLCEFPIKAQVIVSVGRCDECPMVTNQLTPRAGFAIDYFCKACRNEDLSYREIAHYVEYDSEIPPVPNWCPWKVRESE